MPCNSIAEIMEQAQMKAEDNLVRDFRASISHTLIHDTKEDMDLRRRVAQCVGDTRELVNEAADFLKEPHREPPPDTASISKTRGVGLLLAKRTRRRARADSSAAGERVERLLETQIARHVPLPLSLSKPAPMLDGTVKPNSQRRNGLVIDVDRNEGFMSSVPGTSSADMDDLIQKMSDAMGSLL